MEQLANRLWALRRVPAFEAGLFTVRQCEVQMKYGEMPESVDHEDKEVRATWECFLYGLTFIRDAEVGDVLGKISRYETTLVNSIKKLVKLLEESGCTAKSRH